jgi:hypothetical protein
MNERDEVPIRILSVTQVSWWSLLFSMLRYPWTVRITLNPFTVRSRSDG